MNIVRINTVVIVEERANGVFQMTLEDRKNKNMFTSEIIDGLMSAYKYIGECPECKAVIITGYDSYFSSGGTKESLLSLNETRGDFSDVNIYSLALECPVPVISAMQGHGIGGGFVMGLFSDIVILSKESFYTLNFMKYGFTPGMGATLIVPRKLGTNLGNEMLLTANQYRGDELEKRGVAFEVLPRKQVLIRAHELADLMAQKPVESLRLLKQHLSKEIRLLLPKFVEDELAMHSKTMHQPEVAEKIEQLFGNPESQAVDAKIKDMLLALKNKEISSVEARKLIVKDEAEYTEKNIKRSGNGASNQRPVKKPSVTDIAIISVAGRFPKSDNVDQYWENIKQGRDCIVDIPESRGLIREAEQDTVKCRWGGFVNDVDKFDPLFFRISPREAQLMDPQERLLLEEVWNLLESIGYTRKKIAKHYDKKVAVYTASMYQQYHAFNTDLDKKALVSMSSLSSMANRISYFFDFHGPSMALDTMCSATTTAVHLACQSLILGESRLAIVGAANLSIHPYKYRALTQSLLLADRRSARGFAGSGGFIPAETVGAVLLKPLSDAVADGDPILAVIKGSSVNHKGSTDGFSVSNPDAISDLIKNCLQSADVKPEQIGYVETSVAGSEVSDIAELTALKEVFGEAHANEKLPIGTVKSSIGHAEAASGLTQLIKVSLQLRHKLLAPTINHKPVNPNLDIENGMFRIQDALQSWGTVDGKNPLKAIINTLGAGGTGSCLLLEEYISQDCAVDQSSIANRQQVDTEQPRIVMFSAKTEDRLKALVQRNLDYIERMRPDFDEVVYTLHEGREPMAVRLACVVSSMAELSNCLKAWISGDYQENTFFNDLDSDSSVLMQGAEASDGQGLLAMAKHWVLGDELSWSSVYPDSDESQHHKIIPLPTYPFARRYCWLPEAPAAEVSSVPDLAISKTGIDESISVNDSSYVDSGTAESSSIANIVARESVESVSETKDAIDVESLVVKAISEILGLSASELSKTTPLKDMGVTSVTKMLIISAICEYIEPLDESNVSGALVRLDSVGAIVRHIDAELDVKAGSEHKEAASRKSESPNEKAVPHKSKVSHMPGTHQAREKNREKAPEYQSFSIPSYMDEYVSSGYRFTYENSPLGAIKDIDGKSAVIIGAGPAGIMAALSILQAGCKSVHVFDKREAIDRMQMVTIYRNTLPYLKRFGVLRQVISRGSPIKKHNFYLTTDGESRKYCETEINDSVFEDAVIESDKKTGESAYDEFTGDSVLAISLCDLQDVLIKEAVARGANFYWGISAEICQGADKNTYSVTVSFNNSHTQDNQNTSISPGLIVLGDGANSKNAGNIGVSYSIEETSKSEETWFIFHCKTTGNSPSLNYKFSFDENEQLSGCEFGLFYPARGELGVAVYTADGRVPSLEELERRAEFFGKTQSSLINQVSWISKPIKVRFVRASKFSSGNVILTGDAAGTGSPISGMGAVLAVSAYASAIEKYYRLREVDPQSAISEYNENVSSYVDAWQNRSRYIWSQIDRLPVLQKPAAEVVQTTTETETEN